MAADPQGILAIWHDIQPGHVSDVLAWYDREHHFERLGVPGFVSVRRYHAIEGTPRIFVRYETVNADALAAPPYLERLNHPTPWTLRAQPCFRNSSRTVCTRAARAGRAEGGVAATLRFAAAEGAGAFPLALWPQLVETLLGPLGPDAAEPAGIRGVVGVELWRADAAATAIPTAEKRLRGGGDLSVGTAVIVHATDREAADTAVRTVKALLPPDAAVDGLGTYALAFIASNPPAG